MASVFSRILDGELPGHFVTRDDQAAAFLSINPISAGHTLVVPTTEIDHWIDLEPATSQYFMAMAQRIGVAQMQVFAPERVGLMIAGFEVPHVHVHVVPMASMADMDFANAATTVDHDRLAGIARDLAAALG